MPQQDADPKEATRTGQLPPRSPEQAQPSKEVQPQSEEWQEVVRPGSKKKGPPQGERSPSPLGRKSDQLALDRPERVRSQVRCKTSTEEQSLSADSMSESGRRAVARTPDRSFGPISLSDEETSKVRRFQVKRTALYSRPRPCFAKWKQFHNEHVRKMGEGFELVAGKYGCRMSATQILKFCRWYEPEIAAQIRDDDPERQRKMAFAFQHVPEPVDVSDYNSDRKDPDDPSVRWPDDISSLELSSGGSPFPEDTLDRAQAHRQRKSERHERNAAKYEAAEKLDERKRKKSKLRSELKAFRKERDKHLNPKKHAKRKAYRKKRKAEAFWQSDLLTGRGRKTAEPRA